MERMLQTDTSQLPCDTNPTHNSPSLQDAMVWTVCCAALPQCRSITGAMASSDQLCAQGHASSVFRGVAATFDRPRPASDSVCHTLMLSLCKASNAADLLNVASPRSGSLNAHAACDATAARHLTRESTRTSSIFEFASSSACSCVCGAKGDDRAQHGACAGHAAEPARQSGFEHHDGVRSGASFGQAVRSGYERLSPPHSCANQLVVCKRSRSLVWFLVFMQDAMAQQQHAASARSTTCMFVHQVLLLAKAMQALQHAPAVHKIVPASASSRCP
jgi:hypothetical protein